MAVKKITVPQVLQKDLKLLGFLVLNGGVAWFSESVLKNNIALSIIFGGAVNFIAYRIQQELTNEGYRAALKK